MDEQAALAAENIPHLNQGQHVAFDKIVKAVDEQSGQPSFFMVLEEQEKHLPITLSLC